MELCEVQPKIPFATKISFELAAEKEPQKCKTKLFVREELSQLDCDQ